MKSSLSMWFPYFLLLVCTMKPVLVRGDNPYWARKLLLTIMMIMMVVQTVMVIMMMVVTALMKVTVPVMQGDNKKTYSVSLLFNFSTRP